MIQINDKLISEDIFEKSFVCDLQKCKGACCVEGDSGAPLEEEEKQILERIYPKVKPYLRAEGIQAIEEQGTWIEDTYDGEPVTPIIDGKECAYVIFDENGITKCGIEKAWEEGAVEWRKPVSCHLYPIRIKSYRNFDAVNYDRWEICRPACELGKALEVRVYQFLKEPLTRKYGADFYVELDTAAEEWLKEFGH